MKVISVKVIPNAKKSRVVEEKDSFRVYVNSPPADSRANKELVDILSSHLKVKKSRIKIISGTKSRNKTILIAQD